MTPLADPRETLRALVALGEKATPGEWHGEHGEIECDQCGEQAYLCDVTSHAEDDTPYLSLAMQFIGLESLAHPNMEFVVAAANARPALAALGKMCILPVDVVETFVRYARGAIEAGPKALATLEPRERAMATQALEVLRYALAAAEAELRALETETSTPG